MSRVLCCRRALCRLASFSVAGLVVLGGAALRAQLPDPGETQVLTASDGAADDGFGRTLHVQGDELYASAWLQDVGGLAMSGALYVFQRQATGWVESDKLTLSQPEAGDTAWSDFDLSGDTLVVGTPGRDSAAGSNAGAAFVFQRGAAGWQEQAELIPSVTAASARFGSSVAIDGELAVVGARSESAGAVGSGAAYVFRRSGTTWSAEARLTHAGLVGHEAYGSCVLARGGRVYVGCPGYDAGGVTNSGAVFVYEELGGVWTEVETIQAALPGYGHELGSNFVLDGDYLLAGAEEASPAGLTHAGSAYVFHRTLAGWSEEAQLIPPRNERERRFGSSLALQGDRAWVSAAHEAAFRPGHGEQVFLYERSGTTWRLLGTLGAADPPAYEHFGGGLALHGSSVLVGAHQWSQWQGRVLVFEEPLRCERFCYGDGSDGVVCPCSNTPVAGSLEGCAHSAGHGMHLDAEGHPKLSLDNLELRVHRAPPQEIGIFLQSNGLGNAVPFGDGIVCLQNGPHFLRHYSPPTILPSVMDAQGTTVNAQPLSVADFVGDMAPGVTLYYQFVCRDPGGPCAAGVAVSSGIAVRWTP